MTSPVQLYVYDLSNGLARQLSLQLTGKQIDGIWHTSVVVFGKEVFYGQGIGITKPGLSHHGRPLKIIDMGYTSIDQTTFDEYINEIRGHYTADKYHLLEFNCNSFTNDCIGFLTGGSTPSWIKDLPAEFLSTPFGAALRPTIDNMFPGASGRPSAPATYSPGTASSLLQNIAMRAAGSAQQGPNAVPPVASSSLVAPLQVCTNLSSFQALLASHKAVAAFFTSQTCAPCRMVEPVFENLAKDKASVGVAFVKIDLGAGLGGQVAQAWDVRVTPTFLFFLDGKKMHELKGANVPELKSQVDFLIFQAFPLHPHASMDLPAVRAISLNPILFSKVPALNTVESKLVSFIETSDSISDPSKTELKSTVTSSMASALSARFVAKSTKESITSGNACESWTRMTATLLQALPSSELFPLIDLWRLAILDNKVSAWCTANPASNPVHMILNFSTSFMTAEASSNRNTILTTLKLTTNAFSNIALANTLITTSPSSSRQSLTGLLVSSLLHPDVNVRAASASLAFNVAAHFQRPLVEKQRSGRRGEEATLGDSDWLVEITSAVVEAIQREQSEEVVHRLVAALAFFVHLSPYYESELKPFLEVLQVKTTLLSKLEKGENEIKSEEVRKLIKEVAVKLCT